MGSHESGSKKGLGASVPAPSGPQTPLERVEFTSINTMFMQVVLEAKYDALVDLLHSKGIITSTDIEVINSDVAAAIGKLKGIPNVGGDDSQTPG